MKPLMDLIKGINSKILSFQQLRTDIDALKYFFLWVKTCFLLYPGGGGLQELPNFVLFPDSIWPTRKLKKKVFQIGFWFLEGGGGEPNFHPAISARSCKRSKTLFKSLLFWLAGDVSWLAVEVLSPCQK